MRAALDLLDVFVLFVSSVISALQPSKIIGPLVLLLLAWLPVSAAERKTSPNILFILADDLGYGDLGCYGQEKIHTPNIDRLASQGTRFTQVYAGCTVCAPSRGVLMTGLHTGHAWIRGNGRKNTPPGGDNRVALRPADQTIAEILQRSGYKTGLVGKWGLGDAGSSGTPNKKGFHYFYGFLDQVHAHEYYPAFIWRNEERVTLSGNLNGAKGDYIHDLFTREALAFLEQNREQPFFLYLAYTIPHAHNELKEKGMEVPDAGEYGLRDWPEPERNKAAMISRLDRDVGALLDRLDTLGLASNTVVFFSSDNGPHKEGGIHPDFFKSSGPLRGIKRDLYEGGIRVPMIVRWPSITRPGSVNATPWAFWDVLPTLAEIAGASSPQKIDGVSVVPILKGRKAPPHAPFYWEFHEGGFSQACRMGKWKAIRKKPGSPLELYDLAADPAETTDRAAANPRIVEQAEKFLDSARTESPYWPVNGPQSAR